MVNDEQCENGEQRSSFKNGVHRLPFIVHIVRIVHIVHGTYHFTCTQYSNVPYKRYKLITHACTVSPVEKLTNRTTGTLPVRSRYSRGAVAVRSRFGCGVVMVRSRCGQVLSGYAPSSLVVRHAQGSFTPAILA